MKDERNSNNIPPCGVQRQQISSEHFHGALFSFTVFQIFGISVPTCVKGVHLGSQQWQTWHCCGQTADKVVLIAEKSQA